MKAIGLDIGTTTICGVLIDRKTGRQLGKRTVENRSAIPTTHSWQKLQDPRVIEQICLDILNQLTADDEDISAIGVTGQMHGILYLNSKGEPVSPLVTWQDERGNQPEGNGKTYAQNVSQRTGCLMATGFGAVTHYWNTQNRMIPDGAVKMCTIGDFIAMRLAGNTAPILHCSMAASIGLFSLQNHSFEGMMIRRAGMDARYFPLVQQEEKTIGLWRGTVPVSTAFGDNQASFLGAVPEGGRVLVNVGTGSQISVLAEEPRQFEQLECRPYMQGKYLYVGSSLCGGYAYALLRKFYESVFEMCGAELPKDLYSAMNTAAMKAFERHPQEYLQADVRFNGSRTQPAIRGKVGNISSNNFCADMLTLGVLQGICKELYDYYLETDVQVDVPFITGSGNGIRRNPMLQKLFSAQFEKELRISQCEEEAACGSALFALYQAENIGGK